MNRNKIALGSARFPVVSYNNKILDLKEIYSIIDEAYCLEINFIDTCYHYYFGQTEVAIGLAVQHNRSEWIISSKFNPLKMPNMNVKHIISEQLERMKTDYIDYYGFHAVDADMYDKIILSHCYAEQLVELKKDGFVRKIGFSFHDTPKVLKEIIELGIPYDFVICQYNILKNENLEVMEWLQKRDIEVIVMSPCGGGRINISSEVLKELQCRTSFEVALRYVLMNRAVNYVCCGTDKCGQITENVSAVDRINSDFTTERVDEIVRVGKISAEYYCSGCNYCQPCPMGIDIAHVFELANLLFSANTCSSNIPQYIPKFPCVMCKSCERMCPQNLEISSVISRLNMYS